MTAPALWIILPGLAAIGLYLARRWSKFIHIAGFFFAVFLAWLAWQLPIGKPFSLGLGIGLPTINIGESITIFGQNLVIDDASRPVLILIYLEIAFWFAGAYAARASRMFIPIGLGVAALWSASLAAEGGFYDMPILEFVALICIPLLSPPGKRINRGVLRFLTFQTLGLCFILLANRFIPLTTIDPSHPAAIPPGIIWLGIGFALILAIFPFHTWIPMLAESVNPYVAAFLFFTFPAATLLLVLENIGNSIPLLLLPVVYSALQYAGILMVLVGGIWAAFDRHLGRILGFAAITQIGISLLILGLGNQTGARVQPAGLFFTMLLPQCIALALWGQALCAIRTQAEDLRFHSVRGLARKLPIATAALVLANFSLAGLPLLASFPAGIGLWSLLSQGPLQFALLILAGDACLFVAGFRTLAVLVSSSDRPAWRISEGNLQAAVLVIGAILLFVVGLMPQWSFPLLAKLGLALAAPVP